MKEIDDFFQSYVLMLKLSYDKFFYYVKHKMMGDAYVFEIRVRDYKSQIYTHHFLSIWVDKDEKIKLRFNENYIEFFNSLKDFQGYIKDHGEIQVNKFLIKHKNMVK